MKRILHFALGIGLHLRRAWTWDLRNLNVTPDEQARLAVRGVEDEAVCQYLVWRKSTLLVASGITAVNALAHAVVGLEVYLEFPDIWSRLGVTVQALRIMAAFTAPVAALIALLVWRRLRLSRWILLVGWSTAFLVPLMLSLVPPHQLFHWDDVSLIAQQNLLEELSRVLELPISIRLQPGELPRVLNRFVDLAGSVIYGLMLLPAVLSLVGGMFRACLRLKVCLPESVLPGWSLILGAVLHSLGLLIVLVMLNQMTGNRLVLVGVLLFAAAPLVYVVRASLLLRPLPRAGSRHQFRFLQASVAVMMAGAIALLCVYLSTINIRWDGQSMRLLAVFGGDSLLGPWDLIQFGIEYFGRSLFVTVVVADQVLHAHSLVWAASKSFAQSAGAAEYDGRMMNLRQSLGCQPIDEA